MIEKPDPQSSWAEHRLYVVSQLEAIGKWMHNIDDRLGKTYVTQEQFKPVRNIAYGLISTVMIIVVAYVMKGGGLIK